MIIALGCYIVCLCLAAGVVGAYAAAAVAYLTDLQTGSWLAVGVGLGYAALQLLYLGLIRVYRPTNSPTFLGVESAGHITALALTPYLMGAPIPFITAFGESIAEAAQPFRFLVYLGLFVVLHGFLKIISFFAALRGEPAGRLPALAWFGAGGGFGLVAFVLLHAWVQALPKDFR